VESLSSRVYQIEYRISGLADQTNVLEPSDEVKRKKVQMEDARTLKLHQTTKTTNHRWKRCKLKTQETYSNE
jgi:hypothetical protein